MADEKIDEKVTDVPPVTSGSRRARAKDRPVAKKRTYGTDGLGRRVLVAAEGQPIPEGYEVDGQKRSAPAQDHARKGPQQASAKKK